jgi:hypothetical protein
LRCHGFNSGTACFTVFSRNFNFDQFVVVQRDIQLSKHRFGDAGLADEHDGLEFMGGRTQRAGVFFR